jgi:hypothetical protein
MALPFSTNSALIMTPASTPLILTLSLPELYRNPGTTTAIRNTIKAILEIDENDPGGAVVAVLIFGRDAFAIFGNQEEFPTFLLKSAESL